MNFFIIYIAEDKKFNPEHIEEIFRSIKEISEIEKNPDDRARMTGSYRHGDDFCSIELKEDLESLVMWGTEDAKTELALKIQEKFSEPLHIIDDNCNFDLILKNFVDVEALRSRILEETS